MRSYVANGAIIPGIPDARRVRLPHEVCPPVDERVRPDCPWCHGRVARALSYAGWKTSWSMSRSSPRVKCSWTWGWIRTRTRSWDFLKDARSRTRILASTRPNRILLFNRPIEEACRNRTEVAYENPPHADPRAGPSFRLLGRRPGRLRDGRRAIRRRPFPAPRNCSNIANVTLMTARHGRWHP